ncbi:hypothetical protein KC352_g5324 [Hortaea werneckii]|nr:hypothetical protein KC358_g906 [Hortaea werneckii]KAI6944279.1 hypothetical protein KC341_g944 [Hortaea werneckii]KAI6950123.1 hypothetical protein KC348_g862 [Hortaea werneckii]KAI6982224.1 hypothetical protein KC321_g749 [Hortaea werneckii]KAI7049854.1 hypothetical protein KC362_g1015 [Hortaea werneckii]
MPEGEPPSTATLPSRPAKQRQVCRFYTTKKDYPEMPNGTLSCRAGANCAFSHPLDQDAPSNHAAGPTKNESKDTSTIAKSTPLPARPAAVRPMPKAEVEDPRAFQIGQIQRRFKPHSAETEDGTTLSLRMKPSDPDFPYEIDTLECELRVPRSYPNSGRPSIQVTNKDIPRGFQINIERGFDLILSSNPGVTLLAAMNRLDRQLEPILAGRMAETIKIVANRGPAGPAPVQPERQPPPPRAATNNTAERGDVHSKQPVVFTPQQKDEARSKRQSHARQLEARFGRMPSFVKSSDGQSYVLPLESPRKSTWPQTLQSLRSFRLIVPEAYPLESAFIVLESDTDEARNAEAAFTRLPGKLPGATLTQLVNHLVLHICSMAAESPNLDGEDSKTVQGIQKPSSNVEESNTLEPPSDQATHVDGDRPHLYVIPRPPEWEKARHETADESEDTDSDTSEAEGDSSHSDHESEDQRLRDQDVSGTPAEKGILLSFPNLELHGMELLEVSSLSITIKCERCKDTMDVHRLRNYSGNASGMRQETCKKCAITMAVGFRSDMIHANSVRAGYLDLDGCTVVDMLPSNFLPTCAECSTQFPAPGIVAVRGDSAMTICRECHKKMTLRISDLKFLLVSATAARASRALGRKKPKENLGIHAGSELPRKGRCSHYAKSFRGYCSREQNYRPEDCGICHALMVGKKGSGFWEGGKGTRDPKRMSKKDPRKYKRRPVTKPKS